MLPVDLNILIRYCFRRLWKILVKKTHFLKNRYMYVCVYYFCGKGWEGGAAPNQTALVVS